MDEEQVRLMVERGEDLTLGQIVESTRVCKMNCGLFGDPPGWKELFQDLSACVDQQYPHQVDWSVPYCLMAFEHAEEIVQRGIKEKYARILLFSQGMR
jgi:hypothetical protein